MLKLPRYYSSGVNDHGLVAWNLNLCKKSHGFASSSSGWSHWYQEGHMDKLFFIETKRVLLTLYILLEFSIIPHTPLVYNTYSFAWRTTSSKTGDVLFPPCCFWFLLNCWLVACTLPVHYVFKSSHRCSYTFPISATIMVH